MDPARALVVDTDGGIDDAVALWWALTRPELEVLAVVATAGNVDRDTAVLNVGRVLRAAGRTDVPVARGAAGPMGAVGPVGAVGVSAGGAGLAARGPSRHGPDGLGGCADRWPPSDVGPVAEPGAELVARLSSLRPGEIDLVTLGPLTTLAAALRTDPGLAGRLRSVTVMGGRVGAGHVVSAAESNVGRDPNAAAQVLAAPWSTAEAPLLVGLDVTEAARLTGDDLAAAAAGRTAAARFVADPLAAYARAYGGGGDGGGGGHGGGVPCHDLVALVAAVEPEAVTEVERRRLRVAGVPGPAGVPWQVALTVDAARIRAIFRALVEAP
ncbi:MAG TPA: nucleoside hydrolase [Acidimicrobiales bacterium]